LLLLALLSLPLVQPYSSKRRGNRQRQLRKRLGYRKGKQPLKQLVSVGVLFEKLVLLVVKPLMWEHR
jgi:hypothetical protein